MPRVGPGLSMERPSSIPPSPCIVPPSIASSPAASSIRTLTPSISSSSTSSSRTAMSRRSSRSGSSHSNDSGASVSHRDPTPPRSSRYQRSPSPPEPVRELGSPPVPADLPETTTRSAQPSSSRPTSSSGSHRQLQSVLEAMVTAQEHESVSHVSPPPVMLPPRHGGSASGSQTPRRSPVENTSPAASVHGSPRSSRHSSRSSQHSTSHQNVQAVSPLPSPNQGSTSGRSQTNSRPNSIRSSPVSDRGSHASSSQNSSHSHRSSRSSGAVSSPPPPPASMSRRSSRLPAVVPPSNQGSTSSQTASSRTTPTSSSSASPANDNGSQRPATGGSRHSTRSIPRPTQRGQPTPSHRGIRVDTSANTAPQPRIPSDESPLSPSDSDSGYESARARGTRQHRERRREEECRREEARRLEEEHPQRPRYRRPPTPGPARTGIHLFPAGPDEPAAFIPPLDGDVDEPTVEVTPPSPPLPRTDILPAPQFPMAGGMPPIFAFSPQGGAQFAHTPPVYPSTPPFFPNHGGFVPSEPPVFPSNTPPPFRNNAPVIPGVNTPYPGWPAFPNVGHTPPAAFFENTPAVIPASTLNTPVPLPPLPLGPVPQELHYQLKQYYNPRPHDTDGYVSTPSLQWDIVHRPEDTARFLHDMSSFGKVEPDWDADAFRPNTPRLVQFTSTHPIMRFLFAHRPCILDSAFDSIKVGQILVHLYHYLHEPLTANELEWLKQTPANIDTMKAALESRYRHTLGTAPQAGASFLRSDVMGGHRRFFGMQLSARPNGQWKLCVDFISGPVPKLW
ncbi:hypothetical protein BDZ89DRAFT_1166065 [Hymenopellis radicata]|nr:hypothetical protein BDZ89DRAFT_1166065 [Hymenopellis radicata]